jgi:acetoin utilization deacetylase AcuC-like enzyme
MVFEPPMPVVWSETTRTHRPDREVWIGMPMDGSELPERVTVIEGTLRAAGHRFVEATEYGIEALRSVHSPELVRHLSTAYDDWLVGGFVDHGQDRVVPYFFPTAAMLGRIGPTTASSVHARAGEFCYDTMTTLGPGSWEAIRAAADCALTAAALVLGGDDRRAYALCRPPGHHVTADAFGGSCYLNNAALAAQALVDGGHDRVAIIDIDAHHGNGTAAIFYERPDVFYGSVHVDPGAGWFPHVVGHAEETGRGEGMGTTHNIPLAPGSGDQDFLDGIRLLAERVDQHRASALVVSLGVDAAADDPESPLQVSRAGYRQAGAILLDDLDLPTVVAQEGGYHLPTLGHLVAAFLDPADPRPQAMQSDVASTRG